MAQLDSIIQTGVAGLLIILLGMIKIPPIQINFWGWLGHIIGKTINGEVLDRVDKLTDDVDQLRAKEELKDARHSRQRILRFNDEILFGQRHSKEHFDEILEDIDIYERYCHEHPDYENNRADLAIATIQEVYRECLQEHDFLSHKERK